MHQKKKKSCSEQEHNTVISFPSQTQQHLPFLAVLEKEGQGSFSSMLTGKLTEIWEWETRPAKVHKHLHEHVGNQGNATGSSAIYILLNSLKQWNISHLLLLRNIEEHRYFQKGALLWEVMAGTFWQYDENHWPLLSYHFPLFWNKKASGITHICDIKGYDEVPPFVWHASKSV